MKVDGSNWKAKLKRGYAYQAVEKYALALEDLEACINRDPEARRAVYPPGTQSQDTGSYKTTMAAC